MKFNPLILNEVQKASGMNQKEFSAHLGMSHTRYLRIIAGESQLTSQQLADVSKEAGYSIYRFFTHNDGSPLIASDPAAQSSRAIVQATVEFLRKNWNPADRATEEAMAKGKIIEDLEGFIASTEPRTRKSVAKS